MAHTSSATIKEYIADRIHGASVQFARHAIDIEANYAPKKGKSLDSETDEVKIARNILQEYVAGTVIMAVAGIEAMINELNEEARYDFTATEIARVPQTFPLMDGGRSENFQPTRVMNLSTV